MKVLVVEDIKLARLNMRKALEAKGITVIESENGNSALKIFMQEVPDVVSIDIGLPDGNGLELLKEIKAMSNNVDKEIMFLVLSGYTTEDNIIKAYQIGVKHIFTKPVNLIEYANFIKSLKK